MIVAGAARPASVLFAGNTPFELRNSDTAVFAPLESCRPSDTRARFVYSAYCGIAIAARMPMIATTIISSISVKPCCTRFMVLLLVGNDVRSFRAPSDAGLVNARHVPRAGRSLGPFVAPAQPVVSALFFAGC